MSDTHDTPFDHVAVLATIPAHPGVYLMRDRRAEIVYVGKAKDLKARVRSYFSGSDTRPFVPLLTELLSGIDVVLTGNEKEAIILENTLIKRHRPRFNFMLRDDKEFLQLRIDAREPWPWVRIVRRRARDGAEYFGPYHSASACREALRVLNRHFQLRTCRDSVLANRSRPCLQHQIKRCPGPCVLPVDRAAYMAHVHEAMLFLRGRHQELMDGLHARMLAASEALEFERAASIRDQMRAVEKVLERQRVVLEQAVDQDVFGLHREGERISVQVLFVRGGRLQGGELYHLKDQLSEDAEVLSQLLMQHYGGGAFVPAEVLLPTAVESVEAFEELLGEVRGRRVHVLVPRRGPRRDLVETARRNAEHQFSQHQSGDESRDAILERLRGRLGLQRLPRRIECFDISNLQGGAVVASMVVFVDGRPARSQYRTFKVRDVQGQDDFGALFEVVTRRYRRIAEQEEEPGDEASSTPVQVPDLVLIDGGRGQLNAALSALQELGIDGQFDVWSIAKSRTLAQDQGQPQVEHSPERLFAPGADEPLVLAQNSDENFLLQQVRDEAHRVAVGFHRKVRTRGTLRSRLDDVPGVGAKRKAALLRHFGSLERLRGATVDELLAVEGMNRPAAERIVEHFGSAQGWEDA